MRRYGAATMSRTPLYRRWAARGDRFAEPESVARVYASLNLSMSLSSDGKHAEARAIRDEALALARRLADPEATCFAAWLSLNMAFAPRSERVALDLSNEFSSQSLEGVSLRTQRRLYAECSHHFLEWGDRRSAESLFRRARELNERTADPFLILSQLVYEMNFATIDGQFDRVLALRDQLLARSEEVGSPVFGLQFARRARFALIHLGRADEALERQDEADRAAGLEDESLSFTAGQRSLLLAHIGDLESAREQLHVMVEKLSIWEAEASPTSIVATLLECAVLAGDPPIVELLLERLRPAAPLSTSYIAFTCPARLLGLASELLDRPDEARAFFYQALDSTAKVRFRPEIALIRLHLAELLLDHYPDERVEGIGHLDAAIAELRDMKMQPALERALAVRERA